MAHNKNAWVIFFSAHSEECKWRIVRRIGHPTIKNGKGGRIVESLARTSEEPSFDEGFDQIFTFTSFDACNELLNSWGCKDIPISDFFYPQ